MGLQIKEVAKKKGVTITALAARMSVPRRTLYYWIEQNITFEDLIRVSNALQCNVIEVIEPPAGFAHWYNEQGVYNGMLRV